MFDKDIGSEMQRMKRILLTQINNEAFIEKDNYFINNCLPDVNRYCYLLGARETVAV